ncbi:hypothetical protein QBC33DRAFT_538583 [Phialemonium atrogriseum]|uniref:Uncharacterized protein n=1 Tax=Phialemonium atrogriseum TaxID=1093897 RepID=A0AAJ0FLN0_9PEZI|nr:uncharacterized protein QBC33DRAFT_538583 [Phialemonium atrogriseum]KAK1767533.1 hypothetical protein QBC33DRAFT_538583 [Phialemonium atrogriseum]
MAMLAAQRSEWRTIDCTLLLPTLGEALPAAQVQQFHDPGIVIFLPIKAPPGHWVLGILVARSRTAILVDSEPLDPQPLDQHRAMAADRRAVAAKVMGGFVSRYLPEGWNKPEVWAYYTKLGPKLEHAHDSGVYMIASAFHLGHRDKMPATLHLREWRMLIAALMPRITSPTLDLDPNACCEGGAGAAVAPPLKPPPLPFDQDDYLNINFQFMIPSEGTPAPAGLCNMDIYSEELKRRIDLHAGFVRDMVVPGWEHLRRAMSETDDRLNAVREVEAAIPELEGDLGVDIELLAIGKRLRHLEQQTAPGQGQQAGPSNLDSLSARLRYLKSRHFAAAAWGRRVVGLGIPSAIKKLLKLANEQDSLEKQMALGAGWPPLTYDEEEAESRRRSRSSESSSSEVPSLQSVSKSHGTLASGSHLYIGN